MMNEIEKIHHIAMNPLDCDIAHQEGDTLTVKLVKNMAYLIRNPTDGKEPKMNDIETTKQVSPLTNSELEREAFAAGMRKAAEICEKQAEKDRAAHEAPIGSISRGSPYHEGAADSADECVFKILAAIPADARAALSTEAHGKQADYQRNATMKKKISQIKTMVDGVLEMSPVCLPTVNNVLALVSGEINSILNIFSTEPAITEAQPEVTGAVAWVSHDMVAGHVCMRANLAVEGIDLANGTPLYPPSAIDAAVREKLEEAARICELRSRGINCQQSLRDCAKRIRALMESPQPSVEE